MVSVVVQSATHNVDIQNFAFRPAEITINAGDTVTWTQRDSIPHTSTSGESPTPDGTWDSGLLTLNQTFSRTFDSEGVFPYFCKPHPQMTGTVTVTGATPTNQPASIRITRPANNASFTNGSGIAIEAEVNVTNDTVARVEFLAGTSALGAVTNQPYQAMVDLPMGTNLVTAVLTTASGNNATSAPVTIIIAEAGEEPEPPDPIAQRIEKGNLAIGLRKVAGGMVAPLGLAAPNDGSGRLFVHDQVGLVYIIHSNGTNGAAQGTNNILLDVRDRLVELSPNYDERGLLGLALHPQFAQNSLLYTYTSEPATNVPADFTLEKPADLQFDHQNVVAEWKIDPNNSNRVDRTSRRELLRIDHPMMNHNAGTLRFDTNGLLYVALGDGGGADDQDGQPYRGSINFGHGPIGNGQDTNTIHGSLFRIDPLGTNSANGQYGIPVDNPFAQGGGVREIYAYGFRNPYSFSIDRLTGEIYLGDAGQNFIEEVDRVVRGGNYGWNIKEGSFFFDPNGTEPGVLRDTPWREVSTNQFIDPIAEYDHDEGRVVVGGFVYRGSNVPALQGRYIAGDFSDPLRPTGRLFYLDTAETNTPQTALRELILGLEDRPLGLFLKGFGEDQNGELYVFGSAEMGPSGNTGTMLKIVAAPDPIQITSTAAQGTNLNITWNGGTGPYLVQRKETLQSATWVNHHYTTGQVASLPMEGPQGFFRVVNQAFPQTIPFSAVLSGSFERPEPVNTPGGGLATLSLDGHELTLVVHYTNLTAEATAAHIHGPASPEEAAGVLVPLNPLNGGAFGRSGALSGTVTLTPDQKALLMDGKTYINIHTPTHPAGEIRGQIVPVLFKASLSGANERPDPVETPARGSAHFLLTGRQLTLAITYRDLKSPASASHIHGPASPQESAGVLIPLDPFNGGSYGTNGSLSGTTTLSDSNYLHLIQGRTYVNFHTTNHPAGEIRGQIQPDVTSVPFNSWIGGAFERPEPVNSPGGGLGILSLAGDMLSFDIAYTNLTGVAANAHIHGPATPTESAGVLIPLAPFNGGAFGTNGLISGRVEVTPEQKALLLGGRTYVNLHTPNFGPGEVRGQVVPVLLEAPLSGSQERPEPVATPASGLSQMLLAGNQLSFAIAYENLKSPASASHIHGPATRHQSAGVLIPLDPFNGGGYSTRGGLSGALTLSTTNYLQVIQGLTYVNFHTPDHPGGEIRGQIIP